MCGQPSDTKPTAWHPPIRRQTGAPGAVIRNNKIPTCRVGAHIESRCGNPRQTRRRQRTRSVGPSHRTTVTARGTRKTEQAPDPDRAHGETYGHKTGIARTNRNAHDTGERTTWGVDSRATRARLVLRKATPLGNRCDYCACNHLVPGAKNHPMPTASSRSYSRPDWHPWRSRNK